VTYGNGLFVAVGEGGAILTSPDGVSWTARTSGTGDWLFGVTYGNGLFVAVGEGGTILTSRDGVSWTARTSGTSNWLYGVAYGNGLFVAVGGRHHPHLPGRGELDGADLGDEQLSLWRGLRERPLRGGGGRRHHPHLPGRGELDGADLGDEQLALWRGLRERPLRGGGGDGAILTSPDGVSWTARTSGTGNGSSA
jgi:hypothetical protein